MRMWLVLAIGLIGAAARGGEPQGVHDGALATGAAASNQAGANRPFATAAEEVAFFFDARMAGWMSTWPPRSTVAAAERVIADGAGGLLGLRARMVVARAASDEAGFMAHLAAAERAAGEAGAEADALAFARADAAWIFDRPADARPYFDGLVAAGDERWEVLNAAAVCGVNDTGRGRGQRAARSLALLERCVGLVDAGSPAWAVLRTNMGWSAREADWGDDAPTRVRRAHLDALDVFDARAWPVERSAVLCSLAIEASDIASRRDRYSTGAILLRRGLALTEEAASLSPEQTDPMRWGMTRVVAASIHELLLDGSRRYVGLAFEALDDCVRVLRPRRDVTMWAGVQYQLGYMEQYYGRDRVPDEDAACRHYAAASSVDGIDQRWPALYATLRYAMYRIPGCGPDGPVGFYPDAEPEVLRSRMLANLDAAIDAWGLPFDAEGLAEVHIRRATVLSGWRLGMEPHEQMFGLPDCEGLAEAAQSVAEAGRLDPRVAEELVPLRRHIDTERSERGCEP